MNFSKGFIRFNWLTLVSIYLVVIAGSFVRISGSGMGCPDWPRCFGEWIPPISVDELPDGYQKTYLQKRKKKLDKFCDLLDKIGMQATSNELRNDPYVLMEEPFNAGKTWTEYVNRLFGFLAGNFMLACFIWILLKYRKRKLILLTAFNLILMGIQAWFGSIVVASNLVPWTITVHMLLALVIIAIQIYVIYMIRDREKQLVKLPNWMRYTIWFVLAITFYQMFLGTQVREAIDELVKQGYSREEWVNAIGLPFFIHRSFSWLVLVLLTFIAYKNEKGQKNKLLRWTYVMLGLELLSGVLLAYADMPGLVQTAHLVFACVIFGTLTMLVFQMRRVTLVT